MIKQKIRSEIDPKDAWDLSIIFKSEEEFLSAFDRSKEEIKLFPEKNETFIKDGKSILEIFKETEKIERNLDLLSVYAKSKYDEDVSNSKYQKYQQMVSNLVSSYSEKTYYINPTIIQNLDQQIIDNYYQTTPQLKEYQTFFYHLFRYKEHYLNETGEAILSKIGRMVGYHHETSSLLLDSDLNYGTIIKDGEEIELTDSNYATLLRSQDRNVRKAVFENMYGTLKQFRNVFSNALAGMVIETDTFRKVRNYSSNIEASLFDSEIDISVYNNLIDTVRKHMDVLYDYFDFKKEVLNIDELHLYDTYVPLVPDVVKKYTFEEAKEIVIKVLSVFGEEYLSHVKEAFDNHWIDVYPNKGKVGGAYSGGAYDTPPYILLNFEGEDDDVSTLIHEMGHSMHSYYTMHNNPYITGDYKIFVAEVASTVNELLLLYYRLDHASNDIEKMAIINNLLDLFKATIYRQTMFAEFEKFFYEATEKEEILTSEFLSNKYFELVQDYFGSNVFIDDDIRYEWERIPHFYMNFYVYQYATGLSAAAHIVKRIRNKEENVINDYLEFLKIGSKMSPLDSLKVAGVDLTKPEVVESAIDLFKESLEELKKIKKK